MLVRAGVSGMLVQKLLEEMQDDCLPTKVQSVYMTAFQILGESIQDLLQTPAPGATDKQQTGKGDQQPRRNQLLINCSSRGSCM